MSRSYGRDCLDSRLVQVVANLEPFISKNQLRVVPVVGLLAKIEDFRPVLNSDEVDAVFDVPLEMFLKVQGSNSLKRGTWGIASVIVSTYYLTDNHSCEERAWNSWKYVFHCFDFKTEQGAFIICGLSASILLRAASVIYQRVPCFASDLPAFQQLQRAARNAA
ncbi:hypothetical protein CRYUN_Cryun05aG0273300 [Craigia yunnanensis]